MTILFQVLFLCLFSYLKLFPLACNILKSWGCFCFVFHFFNALLFQVIVTKLPTVNGCNATSCKNLITQEQEKYVCE